LLVGCGREDIELVPPGHDGGVTVDDAGMCVPPVGPRKCQADGSSCSVATECCSNRCVGKVCLAAGSCPPPAARSPPPRARRAPVCAPPRVGSGGAGAPVAGTTGGACLAYCLADGAGCTRALDCCSLACNSGACGGNLCKREGDDCTASGECCSNRCGADSKC